MGICDERNTRETNLEQTIPHEPADDGWRERVPWKTRPHQRCSPHILEASEGADDIVKHGGRVSRGDETVGRGICRERGTGASIVARSHGIPLWSLG